MKKTVQVNLSGQVFTLDEDAYDSLSAYLKKISRLYERSAGKDEILSDIEMRISELLLERITEQKQVVSNADVQAVIEIMGNPEQFEEDEPMAERAYSSRDFGGGKRLFRDPDSPLIGGVCSGIGYYFGIDPLWIRLAFAIALIFFGTGFLFYILLWIIIPEAKTTADRLAMKGEPINIESIGKSVEDELNNLGRRFSDTGQRFTNGAGSTLGRGIDKFFNFLAELFRGFFTILGKVLGVAFILIGVTTIVVLLTGIIGVADIIHLGSHGWDSNYSIYEMGELMFNSSSWFWLAVLGGVSVIGIPFLALAYGGLMLLFPSLRVPYLGASLMGLWFLGLAAAATAGLNTAGEFSKDETMKDVTALADIGVDGDTLILEVGMDPFNIPENRAYYANNDFMMKTEGDLITVGNVEFDIRQSRVAETLIEVQRRASADTYEKAGNRAKSIDYAFDADSNTLTFDPFFVYPKAQMLREQEVDVNLLLPVGKTVYLTPSMKRIIDNIDNVQNMYDPRMVGHYWIMTENGLSCADCIDESEETELRIQGSTLDGEVQLDMTIKEN